MRKAIVVLILMVACGKLFAQTDKVLPKVDLPQYSDSSKIIIRDGVNISDDALFIVNGEIAERKNVDTKDLLDMVIMSSDKAPLIYGQKAMHGAVVITTKQYAVKEYQKKLSTFSEKYKQYIVKNRGNDSGIFYLLKMREPSPYNNKDEEIRFLYNLKAREIKSVSFTKKPQGFGINYTAFIATKD